VAQSRKAGAREFTAESLEKDAIEMIIFHPFKMAHDRFLLESRVHFCRRAIGKGHARIKQFIRVQFRNIRPEIDGGIGCDRIVVSEPMDPLIDGGAVAGASEPALIAHEELVVHGAGIDFGPEAEEFVGGLNWKRNGLYAVRYDDGIGDN